MNNQWTYILLGTIVHLALWFFYKKLKQPKIYLSCLVLAICIALFGYLNMDRAALQAVNGSFATWAFQPLLFMVYYWIFRQLFLKIFKNEPLMTYPGMMSWEIGEYRRLHMGDAVFTICTLILPIFTHILLNSKWY